MLVDTVSCIQKEMAILREENRLLRTPATSQVVQVPRRAALTTTKVPRFDGTTSWEQYHLQVFEAIVRSNGWDNVGEDPAIFATALETLAVKAFGDMGRTAQLSLIWDRFIAGHSNCDLRRHLDSVPPETPNRDIVDRCRVWESHADPASRRLTKPNPDPIYPAYVVGEADYNTETTRVAEVAGQNSESHQLEDLLRRVPRNDWLRSWRYQRSRNYYSSW